MLQNVKKLLLYNLFFIGNFSDTLNEKNPDDNQQERIKSIQLAKDNNKNGPYEETSQEGLLIFNDTKKRYEYFYHGVVEKVVWDKIPDEMKNIILSKYELEGKELSWLTLKQILLELNNSLRTKYVCIISEKNQQLTIKFTKKPSKVYFIKSINIYGNKLLSKEKILNAISEGVDELNFVNKILYIITGNSPALFNPGIQTSIIENKIEKLCEKYLILGTKIKVLYDLNVSNQEVKININIEEGKKHFVEAIKLDGFVFDKNILKKAINERGLEDNLFDYLSVLLLEEFNLKRVTFNYSISDNKIYIYATKNLKDISLIVESLLFNVESIRLSYLTENSPVTIGESFDEWAMKDFIYKTNFIFETKLNYKLKPFKGSDKILVEINETIENKSKDIIDGLFLQYPFKYHSPLFSLNFTPKIGINNNFLLNTDNDNNFFAIVGNLNIKHKINHKHIIDIIDGNIGFAATTNIKNLVKSCQVSLFRYFYINRDISLLLIPVNICKYFNSKEIADEEIKKNIQKDISEYIYKYSEIHFKKKITFNDNQLFIRSYGKYFLHDDKNTWKIALHLDNTTDLSKNIKILSTVKGLYNSQDIRNMKSIYKHLSAINNKRDEILGLLWDYYDNMEETFPGDDKVQNNQDFEAYLINKGIVLSNLLIDIRLMLLYNIYYFNIPSFGKLDINLHIFLNFNYDITHNILRLSYGGGSMVCVNNMRFILSAGERYKWLYNNNEFIYKIRNEKDNNIKYGFNLEHVSL
jgi:hypothetical protein